jgi:acetyltransferase-like isoleucine patch superfamily enzyme
MRDVPAISPSALIARTLAHIQYYRLALCRKYWTAMVMRNADSVIGPVTANAKTVISPTTRIGRNVHFNGMDIRGRGLVQLGDNFHSGRGCVIISEIHNYNGDALPYDSAYIERPVRIGDNVWLGDQVMVLGGCTIGEGAIIQAGSVVVSDIPSLAIAGGHPAKVFGTRDTDHYQRLKASRKFH